MEDNLQPGSDQEPENFESLSTDKAVVNQSLTALGFRLPENKIRWFYDGDLMDKPPPLPKNDNNNSSSPNQNNQNSTDQADQNNQHNDQNINSNPDENNCKWVPFKGDDSLKLEREWRKYLTIIQNNAANLEKKHKKSKKVFENSIKFEKVVVCGGMYEVDLL